MNILRDTFIIILVTFSFGYISNVLIFGSDKMLDVRPALFLTIYFSAIISVIYFVCYKFLKSELVFFLVSWAAVLILLYFNVQGGENSQLTLYRFGEPIYLEGKIQPVGIIYKLIDPVLFCALFSTFLFTKYQLNSKEGVNNE